MRFITPTSTFVQHVSSNSFSKFSVSHTSNEKYQHSLSSLHRWFSTFFAIARHHNYSLPTVLFSSLTSSHIRRRCSRTDGWCTRNLLRPSQRTNQTVPRVLSLVWLSVLAISVVFTEVLSGDEATPETEMTPLVAVLVGEVENPQCIYFDDDVSWSLVTKHLDDDVVTLNAKAKNQGAVVGYEDDGCSNEESWRFDSFEDLQEYDGTEEDGKKVFFGSYHTIKQPEYCYALTDPDKMEEIIVIGRRLTPLTKPAASDYRFHYPIRRISRPPPGYSTYARAFDNYSRCMQEKAAQFVSGFKKITGYQIHFFERHLNVGVLGETWHRPVTPPRIRLSRRNIWDYAEAEKYNPWHLTMQTFIQEWVHAEVGAPPNTPWQRVQYEWNAQKEAYDRYVAIYNREPPQLYNTLETFGLTQKQWDSKVSRYKELQEKTESGESLDQEEQKEFDGLERDFYTYERQAAANNPKYNYNHFDLCE